MKRWLGALLVGAGLGVVALGAWFHLAYLPSQGIEKWNERGDAMAPFAAIVAAGALFAAVVSVRLQSTELSLQRNEMVETRKVLDDQMHVQEEQAAAQRQHAEELAIQNRLTEKLLKAQETSNDLTQQLIRAEERNLKLQEQANKFQVYLIDAQRQSQRATLRSAWATLVTEYYAIHRHVDDKAELIKHIKMVEEEISSMALAANPYNGRRLNDRLPRKHPGSFYAPGEREKEAEHRRTQEAAKNGSKE